MYSNISIAGLHDNSITQWIRLPEREMQIIILYKKRISNLVLISVQKHIDYWSDQF